MGKRILRLAIRALRTLGMSKIAFARWMGVNIGEGCRIYISDWGAEPFLISIGNRVTVTAGVRFLTHDGSTWLFHDSSGARFQHYGPITVGNEVFIGSGTIILPGVSIGDRCVIAAGTIVTKDVPDGSVLAGNPGRVIGTYENLERKVASRYVSESDLAGATTYREKVGKAIELERNRRQADHSQQLGTRPAPDERSQGDDVQG